ncbi:unnamed protein product, partial [Prorocentrum cordatum]
METLGLGPSAGETGRGARGRWGVAFLISLRRAFPRARLPRAVGGALAERPGSRSAAERRLGLGPSGGLRPPWILPPEPFEPRCLTGMRVVVVFDFDAARAGFAEPASPPPPLSALAALPLLGEAESGGARAARPARPGAPAA